MALTNGLKRRAIATYKALRRGQGKTFEDMVDELAGSILSNPNAAQKNFLRGLMQNRHDQIADNITDITTNTTTRTADLNAESTELAAVITELA